MSTRNVSLQPSTTRTPATTERTTQTGGLVSRDIKGDHIDFSVGQPNPGSLPLEHIAAAATHRLQGPAADKLILQYGGRQGSSEFRQLLASYLTQQYGYTVAASDLLLTAGVSQGLDLACRMLAQPGDTVLVECPTYFLAKGIFESCRLKVVGVPTDSNGLRTDVLEEMLLQGVRPAAVYTIPVHNNPCATTQTPARRQKLLQLAHQHSFFILADEVYQLMTFPGCPAPPQPMHFWEQKMLLQQQLPQPANTTSAQQQEANNAASILYGSTESVDSTSRTTTTSSSSSKVVSFGSFSKIMAPGLRLGWIEAPPHIMSQLKKDGALNSGGCMVSLSVGIMHSAMQLGLLEQNLQQAVLPALQAQADAMVAALKLYCPACSFVVPQGGYFVWLQLPEGADAAVLLQRAAEKHEVKFLPGAACMGSGGCLRLSFAFYTVDEIWEGVERLGRALQEHLKDDVRGKE